LPGGKKNESEGVLACVKRELDEEVGLDLIAARPVSKHLTKWPGFPRVTSVGVAAIEWRGEAKRREHLAHSEWRWYPLDALPEPLFAASQLVLETFLEYPDQQLSWNDLDNVYDVPPLFRTVVDSE
jgi:8-oxo-dGTP pyrophosphatase MutT (NUDIX family)